MGHHCGVLESSPPLVDYAQIDPVLREVILPGIREYLQNATVLLKYVRRNTQKNPNGELIVVFRKQRDNNAGSGAAENADLVAASPQGFGRATIPAKTIYKRCRWTGKAIAATSTQEALIDAIMAETKFGTMDFETSMNRQLNGDGRDTLGFYVSGAGGASVVVTDQWGNVGGDYFQSSTTTVDLINGSDHSVRQAGLVATRGAIVATGRTITVSPVLSGAATAGDYFVLGGVYSATAVSQQLMGIRGIVSAGNPPLLPGGLQGVTVASVPEFAASIVDSGADASAATWADFKFENLQRILFELDRNSEEGQEGVDLIYTSIPGVATYQKYCKDEKITVNDMKLDGGFTGLSFNGRLPVVGDKHARLGAYFALNFDSFGLFQLQDIDWLNRQGSNFEKIVNKDVWESTLAYYGELGVETRNANAALVGTNMLYN